MKADARLTVKTEKELDQHLDEGEQFRKQRKRFHLEKIMNLALERNRSRQKDERKIH
jgi:hypothetical protein